MWTCHLSDHSIIRRDPLPSYPALVAGVTSTSVSWIPQDSPGFKFHGLAALKFIATAVETRTSLILGLTEAEGHWPAPG
jgi:hypothetical protein